VPRIAFQLLRVTSTPLTLVLPHAKNLAPQLLPSNRSLGIRVTREPFSHALCRAFGKPIVSSSANISGQPTPTRFALISPLISTGVDFIVSCRQNDPAPAAPSSIIQFLPDGSFAIIR
jgi:L-threonylcarbamoyladenylate synthase